jgi:prepilin-type N-terminal cleavage/methylation domain-containing protein
MQPIKMMSRKTQSGFSLIELLIVVAIAMILMAMTAPLVVGTLNTYYLRQAGTEYANMLQSGRMRAVQDDQYYVVQENYGGQAAGVANAFVNTRLDPGMAYLAGDPLILVNLSIAMRARAAAPSVANLESQFLPNGALGVSINPTAWGPSFGPRGLPCKPTAAVNGVCNYTDPNLNFVPIAFESFFQSINAANNWVAVTVNPAGRVREWYYDAASATWKALN